MGEPASKADVDGSPRSLLTQVGIGGGLAALASLVLLPSAAVHLTQGTAAGMALAAVLAGFWLLGVAYVVGMSPTLLQPTACASEPIMLI